MPLRLNQVHQKLGGYDTEPNHVVMVTDRHFCEDQIYYISPIHLNFNLIAISRQEIIINAVVILHQLSEVFYIMANLFMDVFHHREN